MNLTKNFEINIVDLIKDKYLTEPVSDQLVKVYYITKGRGNDPKPFILPRTVKVDKEFMEAIATYLGDGKLSKDLHHLEFTSIDKDMLDFMSSFFEEKFNLNPMEFTKKKYAFQINGKILRILFERIINKIYESDFYSDTELRRAFLRGLFAAEGNIAINRKENYIVYMQYCLHINEDKITYLLMKCLDLENISHVVKKEKKDNSMSIRWTNWKNYCKCWKISLFESNKRKNNLFLNKVKKTKFFFEVKGAFIKKLLNSSGLPHRQIGLKLGIRPETLCILNKFRTKHVNWSDFNKLIKFNKINLKEARHNILTLRANRVTTINDKEFIDFIFDLKNFA